MIFIIVHCYLIVCKVVQLLQGIALTMMEIIKQNKEAIAFAYIYNIEPSEDILDVDFNGYRILPIEIFKERYKTHIDNLLRQRIMPFEENFPGLNCKYILCATSLSDKEGKLVNLETENPYSIFWAFFNTVFYCRLYKAGNLQLGTFFISYKNLTKPAYRELINTDFSCFAATIYYREHVRACTPYKIDKTDALNILQLSKKLDQKDLEDGTNLNHAIWAFCKPYTTTDIFYKITGFITSLETLLADDGKEGEISFKLRTRLVYLLHDSSIADFIQIIYELRSCITHVGGFKKSFVAKYVKKHGIQNWTKYLFVQIDKLEEICRQVIRYYFEQFSERDKFNIEQMRTELNKEIFETLAKHKN